MRILKKSGLVLALALPFTLISAPAVASDKIVVQSTAAMQQWQKSVTRDLGRRLTAFERIYNVDPVSGIVQLHFTLDEDGRATNIETRRSSGDSRTDLLARHAVRSLTRLGEAPVAAVSNRQFIANIVFADSNAEKLALLGRLAHAKSNRLANAEGDLLIGS